MTEKEPSGELNIIALMDQLSRMERRMEDIDQKIGQLSEDGSRIKDRMTMLETIIAATNANVGHNAPYRSRVVPTGKYMSEPRSRWKRGWFYS